MDNEKYNEIANDNYLLSSWGDDFFYVNEKGNLCVLPEKKANGPRIDIMDVIEEIKEKKIQLPAVVRFHDILWSQVKQLNEGFNEVIKEANYKGQYSGVYPIKVNQMREVVEEIVEAGKEFNYGLEAGSKPEILSVLSLNSNTQSLTILNGYKDEQYLKLALLGRKLERKIIVVIEKYSELVKLIKLSKEMKVKPIIGLRARINSRGSGRWSESGGERAKFGLSITEIIQAIDFVKSEGLLDCVKLFHFHIGSQVTNIQTIKSAINEGARIYSKLYRMGVPLEYFDVGGGLGVDYDGSKSGGDSSRNYTAKEYMSDVVYGLMQICDDEEVPHPNIVSESGRAITAHHSCIITNVVDVIDPLNNKYEVEISEEDHILVQNIKDAFNDLNESNIQEIYNDALAIKGDSINAFSLGVLELRERALIETYFSKISDKIVKLIKDMEDMPEDLESFEESNSKQYLCNFSVFQSLPDVWAINQLVPIVPLQRLNEEPTIKSTLVDITCDSDGKINSFIQKQGSANNTINLHKIEKDEEYYLGFFLTGAYQDVMGDMHNLFGRLNEVHIFCDDDDPTDFYIEEYIKGSSSETVLTTMQYNSSHMAFVIKKELDKAVKEGRITPREGVQLTDFYEESLSDYTYLEN